MKEKTIPMSKGARDVVNERNRQIEEEGWNKDHDSSHTDSSLALAGACYAIPDKLLKMEKRSYAVDVAIRGDTPIWKYMKEKVPKLWPESWHIMWWKPKTRRENLVRSAALIIAEIDRLDNSEATE